MERELPDKDQTLLIKLSERNHHIDMRKYYESQVVREDNIIMKLSDEIGVLRRVDTGTQLDLPPLRQNLFEMLGDKILKALDRLPR